MKLFAALSFLLGSLSLFADSSIAWPTESVSFQKGEPYENYIQPTAGSMPSSGLFGDVRNSGYRFHEGIDIKPTRFDKKQEALDDVKAAMKGKVLYINTVSGNSSYGRYVVLEHTSFDVAVYTLYAHLASVDEGIKIGQELNLGDRIGRMGRSSATYKIPKANAHLHFEVGLMLTRNFNAWYAKKGYKEKNFFGNANGMNLMGMDPLAFLKAAYANELKSGFADYIKNLKPAIVVRYYTTKTPDFVKLYPKLASTAGNTCGWDIYFTWFGMPTKLERPINPRLGAKEGEFEIIKYDPSEITRKCRQLVTEDSKVGLKSKEFLRETLEKMFQ